MRNRTTERSRQSTNGLAQAWAKRALCLLLALFTALSFAGCERTSLSDGLAEGQDCSVCHGSKANAAPPKALNGSWSTTDLGVGAHQAHLVAGNIATPVSCTECHVLPTDLLTHPDLQGRPALVTFGERSTQSNAKPTWNRASATCSNTYCHGSKLSGAEQRADPVWTRVDGTQRQCTACHGFPPSGSHPSTGACDTCHGEVVSGARIKDLSRHINGIVEFNVPLFDAGAEPQGVP
jgi:predicted CxxxxCH...CXXCH cytochrome family protein